MIRKLDYNTEDLESLSNSELKKVADYWLRRYLISREPNSTFVRCPLKNRDCVLSQIQVAHYIDRINMWTRYDLQNCHLVSKQSNTWESQVPKEGHKSLHHYDYEQFLISKYGNDIIKILREKAENKEIFRKENYIEVIKQFRNE
jgi:hypothetical protein